MHLLEIHLFRWFGLSNIAFILYKHIRVLYIKCKGLDRVPMAAKTIAKILVNNIGDIDFSKYTASNLQEEHKKSKRLILWEG